MNAKEQPFDFSLKIPADKVDSVQITLNIEIFATLKTIQVQLSELIAHQKDLNIKETLFRHDKAYDETRVAYFKVINFNHLFLIFHLGLSSM
jgi:hypothetical protein